MDTLVLSVGYEPICTTSWFDAFCQVLRGVAVMVEEYPDRQIQSVRKAYPMPSVIQLKKHVPHQKHIRFSRENVWLRDGGKCGYCQKQCSRNNFTYDHVIPKTQGGKTTFENIVICCLRCNQLKGGRTPKEAGMTLHANPISPKFMTGFRKAIRVRKNMPKTWSFYLDSNVYWNIELEEDT
jgi:5-methylcytosine-specific restriction endonuclease McrA